MPGAADGAHRELYDYSDDGQLVSVDAAEAGSDGVFGASRAVARYTRDALGRVLAESDYDATGRVAHSRVDVAYDNADRVLSETDTQVQGTDTFTNYVSNRYDVGGTLASSSTQSWKAGGGSTGNATTTYGYAWREGALTARQTLTNTDGSTASVYGYDPGGRLTRVELTGGARPRTVNLATDLAGEILTRDEASAASLNPHARHYVFDGVELGTVSNDGTDNRTFASAVAAGEAAPGTGPFRGGATGGSAYASFDRQHDAVNPGSVEGTPGLYTAREGDTAASIAQGVWGDANLWYLLAAANGLAAGESLPVVAVELAQLLADPAQRQGKRASRRSRSARSRRRTDSRNMTNVTATTFLPCAPCRPSCSVWCRR